MVQYAETRTAFALAYRERVAIEYAAGDQGDAVPSGDEGRRSPAATGTEGDRAFRLAEHSDAPMVVKGFVWHFPGLISGF